MAALEPTAECFAAFYREIHNGRESYRWQRRAAAELAAGQGLWSALQVPTGAGKTTLVECFLFALACSVGRQRRRFPVRLFWVVDRRSVVDQIYVHARLVANATADAAAAADGIAAGVQRRLAKLAAGVAEDEPVQVRLWRGGFAGEASLEVGPHGPRSSARPESTVEALLSADCLRSPLAPCAAAVVCSTVDQVGSRMLFRGYGVSRRSRPVEAALVATDSLIVLDEAHLSAPFRATASAIAAMQSEVAGPLPPLQVLPISATTDTPGCNVFELTPQERADPLLVDRLGATKPAALARGRNPVSSSVASARELAGAGAVVIGVVANTVATARAIASSLQRHGDVVLVIGPARPLDRADLLGRIPERSERSTRERPLFVVGTQTLEVGLDLDFDALVTACAPLPTLIQRFGRLDRAGELATAGRPGRGIIVQPPKRCPVYGEATLETWSWLSETAARMQLEFRPEGLSELFDGAPAVAREVDQPTAPLLGPWHTAVLAQTSHDPEPDPDVAVFLHGERALEPADVQLCWRADLRPDAPDWVERVRARPPHPGELLSLPSRSVQRWLTGGACVDELADVEALGITELEQTLDESPRRGEVIRVPPPDPDGMLDPQRISPTMIRSGDVIVMPAYYGGCDEFGWAPSSTASVSDLGNLAQTRARVLLAAAVGTPEGVLAEVRDAVRSLGREEISEEDAYEQLRDTAVGWLRDSDGHAPSAAAERVAHRVGDQLSSTGRAVRHSNDEQSSSAELLLVPSAQTRAKQAGRAVSYRKHVMHVVAWMENFVKALSLPAELGPTLIAAARYHDLGKLDPRFQAWLNDGSAVAMDEPLAKSRRHPSDRRSRSARVVAGWPLGKRHEATSAALLDAVPSWPAKIDRDLLIHLVATHHGDGRPFRFHALDLEPMAITVKVNGSQTVEVAADAEVPWHEHARRFVTLNERFGPWGLAALESLLVLADRGASATEES